jgi:hypothetical protein
VVAEKAASQWSSCGIVELELSGVPHAVGDVALAHGLSLLRSFTLLQGHDIAFLASNDGSIA